MFIFYIFYISQNIMHKVPCKPLMPKCYLTAGSPLQPSSNCSSCEKTSLLASPRRLGTSLTLPSSSRNQHPSGLPSSPQRASPNFFFSPACKQSLSAGGDPEKGAWLRREATPPPSNWRVGSFVPAHRLLPGRGKPRRQT